MANPYLCFAALMMAGLDGIENKIHPARPPPRTSTTCPPRRTRWCPPCATASTRRWTTLDKDRGFLTKGGVFTDAMLDAYIELKMTEVNRIRVQVNPAEYDMYYSL
jgi:glutamine synthetase